MINQLRRSKIGYDPETGECDDPAPPRSRSFTITTIPEIAQRRRQRARAASLTQPVATIW